MYSAANHTFAICAYHDNPFLETTIESLEKQTALGQIILSTSTPSAYIADICSRHSIKQIVNPHPNHAGDDWNYAYDSVTTPLVTIVHQDDYYEPQFLEMTLSWLNERSHDDVVILFSDYYELRNGKKESQNTTLRVKRIMNAVFRWPGAAGSRFARRRVLSFGCPICCPAVTFVKKNAGNSVFDTNYVDSCDYKTWVNLANLKGSFVYIPEKLVGHRIYAESATTHNLSNGIRKTESEKILESFWPAPVARMIGRLYSTSEKSNDLK